MDDGLLPVNQKRSKIMRKYLTVCVGVASSLISLHSAQAQSAFSNAVAALSPVAYWPLNETTPPPDPAPAVTNLGSLGAGFDATYGGNVIYGVPGALASGGDTAAGFDGLSGSAITPYGSGIANPPSFTIEAWILSHNINATQCPVCDIDAASSGRSGWLIYMDISNPGQYTFRGYEDQTTTPALSFNIGAPDSIAQDTWNHVVVVVSNAITATNVYGYINGVLVSGPTAMTSYVPNDGNNSGTFCIGERSDSSFFFDGEVDEVSYYGTALDPNTIAAHYSAGTNTSPGTPYNTLVLASDPLLYFRMDQPATPVANNYGSLGAAVNGYYETGTVPGAASPSFGAFGNGFGGGSYSTQFSPAGTESSSSGPNVTCAPSDPSVLNYTNSITVSAWVQVPTNAVGWFEGVLGRGDSSYRFAVDTGGLPHFADGGNADIVGVNPINDGNWHYWVGTYDSASSNAVLYIDSVSSATATWSPPAGNLDNYFVIGGAPDYNGRNFVGDIADVAIFDSALSITNIQAIYNSAAPSPYELAVVALGPLAYWPLTETAQPPAVGTFTTTNLGTVGSALDATFTGDVIFGIPGALAGVNDSADEFNGSTDWARSPYTADLANPPSFTIEAWLLSHNIAATQCPVCDIDAASSGRSGWLIYMDISNPGQYTFRGYEDQTTTPALSFNIGAPDSIAQDEWNHVVVVVSNAITATNVYGYINGVLVSGPTAMNNYVPNDGNNAGTFAIGQRSDSSFFFDGDVDEVAYYTNALDAATIMSHYQAGTNPAPATAYSSLVLQQSPIIYFQMDEASVGTPYPGGLPVAANYGLSGSNANGYYEPGTIPGAMGPFGSNSYACEFFDTGGPTGSSGPGVLCDPFSFTGLLATNGLTVAAWVQVPTTPNPSTFETVLGRGDSSYRFSVDGSQLPHFAAAPNGDLVGTIAINDGDWHLWTGVYDPVAGEGYLYIDGILEASAPWLALTASEQLTFIGGAPDYNTRGFMGSISHVAIFTNALTHAQIQATYATIGVPPSPPTILQQPAASEILFVGSTLTASVVANGPGTLTYQWYFNGTNVVANATSANLSLANVQSLNAGSYDCVVSNRYGTTNSTALVLTVLSTLPDAYDGAVLAQQPIAFYPLNETTGTTAYEYVQGNNGTYETNALIGQPGITDPPYLGFPATDFSVDCQSADSNSWVFAPFGTLAGPDDTTIPNVTFTCWIYPVGTQSDSLGLIFDRGGVGGGLDMGQGDSSQMLGYTWNGNNADTYDFVSGLTPPENQWSFVALTIAPTEAILYLYDTNSRASATNAIPHAQGLLGGLWHIGNDAAADPGRTFNGMIEDVAIFASTLSAGQLNGLFDTGSIGTTNIPPIVTVPSTPITVDQGASTSIPSTVLDGPPPYHYQWSYVNAGVTNVISGATNAALTLTDVQAVQASYNYFVVVTNNYGAGTSSFATLNIISGPPTLVSDVSPLLTVVPAGLPVSFFVAVTGTEPFSYQWSNQGGAIAGATTSSYTLDALAGTNSYFVTITNSAGSIVSSTAVVVGVTNAPPLVSFGGNGTNWTFNQGAGWPGATNDPGVIDNVLTLTDGTNGENCSAIYDIPQYIGGFIATFTYQVAAASSVADGITFVLEDTTNTASGLGTNAIGGGGGDLGYNGIEPSVAFEMNVYTGSSGGVGIAFGTNGLTPDSTPALPPYGPTAPVNISSFDPIFVQLIYSQNVMSVLLKDGQLSYKTNYYCNIPATLGSQSAYIGFTGGDGAVNSIQTITDFTFSYTTSPILTLAKTGVAGTVVVSWPVSVTTLLVLQEATSLNGTWSNVGTVPTVVGSENQVTLTPGTSTVFYRLSLQ